ncbi:hypothetical protein ACJX0J_015471, partial [Zea mays]
VQMVLGGVVYTVVPFYKRVLMVEGERLANVQTAVEVVEHVAEVTEKLVADAASSLPENGSLHKVVVEVECVAEAVDKDAHKVEAVIDKGCPIAYLAAIQIYGKQWLSLLSQHKEKAWFSSSVKSRLQYLGPQPGILVLDDEHVKGVHLDPLAGPVDAFCLLVLDPEKNVRRASTLPRALASGPRPRDISAARLAQPRARRRSSIRASIIALPAPTPAATSIATPVLGAPLHACCDIRLVIIPTLHAHSPAPANQPAMPPPT